MSKYPDAIKLDPRDPLNNYVPAVAHNVVNLSERMAARRRALAIGRRQYGAAEAGRTLQNLETFVCTRR